MQQTPLNTEHDTWRASWERRCQSLRTQAEIGADRRQFLAERRAVQPDEHRRCYPFSNVPLNRADVEWLLATNEAGRGPVYWGDAAEKGREGLDLRGADLGGAKLSGLPLAGARLSMAILDGADLWRTHLEGAELWRARLRGVDARQAHFERADLVDAHLEGARLNEAFLQGADLTRAFCDAATELGRATLCDVAHGSAQLVDVRWQGANLATVRWEAVPSLGDEQIAHGEWTPIHWASLSTRDREEHLATAWETAVRANLQLANALREHGLSDPADYFGYRAQVLRREVFRREGSRGRYLFWTFLQKLAGYGYRPGYVVLWYVLLVGVSTLLLWWQGAVLAHPVQTLVCTSLRACAVHTTPAPSQPELLGQAFVASITAIHGRGFFPEQVQTFWQWAMVAFDAVAGLVIEASFVATFVQRFFAR